jgi:hypothetical protein
MRPRIGDGHTPELESDDGLDIGSTGSPAQRQHNMSLRCGWMLARYVIHEAVTATPDWDARAS